MTRWWFGVMVVAVLVAALVAAGCSGGGRAKTGDGHGGDARGARHDRDAGGSGDGSGGSGSGSATTGTVEVHVEWKNAPAAVRASPGRNACGLARPGRAKVHTLWGLANAVVIVDAAGGPKPAAAAPVMLTITDCAVAPAVAIARGAPAAVRLYDGDSRRHALLIAPAIGLERLADAPAKLGKGATVAVLPWLGHEVEQALPEVGVVGVASRDQPEDIAWVVVADQPFVGITDETGAVELEGVPPGAHAVTAWLPPAAGEAGKLVTGTVTVEVGRAVKVTMDVGAATSTPGVGAGSGAGSGSGSGAGSDDDDDDGSAGG